MLPIASSWHIILPVWTFVYHVFYSVLFWMNFDPYSSFSSFDFLKISNSVPLPKTSRQNTVAHFPDAFRERLASSV